MKRLVYLMFFISCTLPPALEPQTGSRINSPEIHEGTGLIVDEGIELVIGHCTPCHSAKLITQNRANREGWKSSIRWMQKTQKLWDLGENEDLILNYLAKNYAPETTGRRRPLDALEWYQLVN